MENQKYRSSFAPAREKHLQSKSLQVVSGKKKKKSKKNKTIFVNMI